MMTLAQLWLFALFRLLGFVFMDAVKGLSVSGCRGVLIVTTSHTLTIDSTSAWKVRFSSVSTWSDASPVPAPPNTRAVE